MQESIWNRFSKTKQNFSLSLNELKKNLLKMHGLPLNRLDWFTEVWQRTGSTHWKARLTEYIKMLIIKQGCGSPWWNTIKVKASQCRKFFKCLVLHLDCMERSFHCTSKTLFCSLCKLLGSAAKILKAALLAAWDTSVTLLKWKWKLSFFCNSKSTNFTVSWTAID